MALFGRGPNAPTALYEVGQELGWPVAASVDIDAIQPPTHARADVHTLHRFGSRWQAWAIEGPDGVIASHLEVFNDEYDQPVYDVVGRAAPHTAHALPHLEIGWGLRPYGHHRLADRFGSAGSRKVPSPVSSMTVHASRACDPRVEALVADPRLAVIGERASAISRTGLAAEVVAGRAVVFTTTAAAARGTQRWHQLIAAEQELAAVLQAYYPSLPGRLQA